MKKYSHTRMFIEYVLIMFGTYLLLSLVIAIIGNYSYRAVLSHYGQLYGLSFLYWWIPIFRMADMDDINTENQKK